VRKVHVAVVVDPDLGGNEAWCISADEPVSGAYRRAFSLTGVPIPYGRQSIDADDVQAVAEVLQGDWLTQGPHVAEFESAFAEVCSVPFAVAFSSGTAALHGAAFAAGVGPGDELVTSAISFAASANCGAYLGARPRFADIERDTWNVSAATVAPQLSERTRAVVPVHFTGLPAPMEELRAACGPDVALIEDAAHALGASVDGVPVGACVHSDMACFSFHPVKAIASGEGGMVTTRNPQLRDRLQEFRNHGNVRDPDRLRHNPGGWHYEQQSLGFNYRLSDIHSALGRSQLRKLSTFIGRRNEIAQRYRDGLGDLSAIELCPQPPPGTVHAYHLFVIRHRDGEGGRRALYDALREREIFVQIHYAPIYLHPWYRDTYGDEPGLCPEAERYYAGCLSLPCFATLTEAEQDTVIAAVRELA
jgi:UDP-4-amino-4,6-dideoxy-N-acetyl-beta-L-altrosamine transaminase